MFNYYNWRNCTIVQIGEMKVSNLNHHWVYQVGRGRNWYNRYFIDHFLCAEHFTCTISLGCRALCSTCDYFRSGKTGTRGSHIHCPNSSKREVRETRISAPAVVLYCTTLWLPLKFRCSLHAIQHTATLHKVLSQTINGIL